MSDITVAAAAVDTAIAAVGVKLGLVATPTPSSFAADLEARTEIAPYAHRMGIIFEVHAAAELDVDVLDALNTFESALAGLRALLEALADDYPKDDPMGHLYATIGRVWFNMVPAAWRGYTHAPAAHAAQTIASAAAAAETYHA